MHAARRCPHCTACWGSHTCKIVICTHTRSHHHKASLALPPPGANLQLGKGPLQAGGGHGGQCGGVRHQAQGRQSPQLLQCALQQGLVQQQGLRPHKGRQVLLLRGAGTVRG